LLPFRLYFRKSSLQRERSIEGVAQWTIVFYDLSLCLSVFQSNLMPTQNKQKDELWRQFQAKIVSRPSTLSEVVWCLGLSALLLSIYFLCRRAGLDENDSKGISLLALLTMLGIGFAAYRMRLKAVTARDTHRFEGLSLEQKLLEVDKMFEEQVAAGILTRAQLDEAKANAKARYERERGGGRVDNGRG
jgi:hypothetical protein